LFNGVTKGFIIQTGFNKGSFFHTGLKSPLFSPFLLGKTQAPFNNWRFSTRANTFLNRVYLHRFLQGRKNTFCVPEAPTGGLTPTKRRAHSSVSCPLNESPFPCGSKKCPLFLWRVTLESYFSDLKKGTVQSFVKMLSKNFSDFGGLKGFFVYVRREKLSQGKEGRHTTERNGGKIKRGGRKYFLVG